MKYAWIEKNVVCWPVRIQCRVLEVSVSGYYQHYARRRKITARRHLSQVALLVEIRAVDRAMRGAYRWPRVWRQLKAQGVRVGKLLVQLAMQQAGIRARGKRRFRICTTDSRHTLPVAANLLDRNFTVHQSNVAWVGDIAYIPTRQGWLYLATVLGLFSRRIVGWSMSAEMSARLPVDALEMAWHGRSPGRDTGLIFHSDRASMSRKGNCWDNACAETLFGSLKVERLHGMNLHTYREVKDATLEWVLWYNGSRMHSTLGYLSPAQFERQANAQPNAVAA